MNTAEPSLTKTELRKSLLNTRKSLSAQEWRQKRISLQPPCKTRPLHPSKNNPRLTSVVAKTRFKSPICNSPQIGIPRCVGKELSWHIWQPGDALHTGAYGILEPLPDAPKIDRSAVDLMLVPAVGCDVRGYRLGYGGGYYNRCSV